MPYSQIIGLSQPTATINATLKPIAGQFSMSRSPAAGSTGSNNVQLGVNGTLSMLTVVASAAGTTTLGTNGTNLNSTVIATTSGTYTDTTHTDVLSASGLYYANVNGSVSTLTSMLQTNLPTTIFGGGENSSGMIGTGYVSITGPDNNTVQSSATTNGVALYMPIAGTFSLLRGYGQGVGTMTLNVNGTDKSLSITLAGGAYSQDSTDSVVVNAGDTVCLHNVGTAANPFSVNFTPTTPNGDNILSCYFPSTHGGALLIGEMNGSSGGPPMPYIGTCQHLGINTGNTTGTTYLYKNGTPANQMIISTSSGNYIDTTHTDTFGTTDVLTVVNPTGSLYRSQLSLKQAYVLNLPNRKNFQIIG